MDALLEAIASIQPSDDARRIFHGRGGRFRGCENWTLDAYPPVWVLTSFTEQPESALEKVQDALQKRLAQIAPMTQLHWVYQCRAAGMASTRLMSGSVPESHQVSEDATRYLVHVDHGQNHGLFLDMSEGRRWVRRYADSNKGLSVLNLFAYTCAFSVVALQAGAGKVVNVDMSRGALTTGQKNHQINGISKGASFLAHDIFSSWGKITRAGPYGLVIVDPPSYQKGSFVATKDYDRLIRRLPDLLEPGGYAMLCLNAPELDSGFIRQRVEEIAPALEFVQRLPNPAAFDDISPERALKVMLYRAPV